jgi:hypothetical protein
LEEGHEVASELLKGLQSSWMVFFRALGGACCWMVFRALGWSFSELLEGLQSSWRGFRALGWTWRGFRALGWAWRGFRAVGWTCWRGFRFL